MYNGTYISSQRMYRPRAARQNARASQARLSQEFISKMFTLLQHHGHLGLAGLALGLTVLPAYFRGTCEAYIDRVTHFINTCTLNLWDKARAHTHTNCYVLVELWTCISR